MLLLWRAKFGIQRGETERLAPGAPVSREVFELDGHAKGLVWRKVLEVVLIKIEKPEVPRPGYSHWPGRCDDLFLGRVDIHEQEQLVRRRRLSQVDLQRHPAQFPEVTLVVGLERGVAFEPQ